MNPIDLIAKIVGLLSQAAKLIPSRPKTVRVDVDKQIVDQITAEHARAIAEKADKS